jgi:hypothetical protein
MLAVSQEQPSVPTCPDQVVEVMVGLIHKYRRDFYGCASVVAIISITNGNLKSGLIAGLWYAITVIMFHAFWKSDSKEI